MIFVLDTNVLSESTKETPDPKVLAFIRAVPAENVRLSAVVLAEIAQGVANNRVRLKAGDASLPCQFHF